MTRMTKKAKLLVVSISLIVVLIGSVFAYKAYRKNKGVYVETVKQGKDAWGYRIYVKGRLVVKQEVMPAVPGNNAFPCEEAARKTAELVVMKVGKGDSPSVTKQEVDDIVKKNCK
jgi:Domain of unknown function (DUF4907)